MSNIPSYCPYQGATVPPPWSRATLSCINYQNPNITVNDLDMRRKAQILQYNKNQNNPTKQIKEVLKGIHNHDVLEVFLESEDSLNCLSSSLNFSAS